MVDPNQIVTASFKIALVVQHTDVRLPLSRIEQLITEHAPQEWHGQDVHTVLEAAYTSVRDLAPLLLAMAAEAGSVVNPTIDDVVDPVTHDAPIVCSCGDYDDDHCSGCGECDCDGPCVECGACGSEHCEDCGECECTCDDDDQDDEDEEDD